MSDAMIRALDDVVQTMPAKFEHCIKAGGRVRTITHGGGTYQPICFSGGKSYAGHVHVSKNSQRQKRGSSAKSLHHKRM